MPCSYGLVGVWQWIDELCTWSKYQEWPLPGLIVAMDVPKSHNFGILQPHYVVKHTPRHDDSCCHVPMALGEYGNGFMSFVHDLNVRIDPFQASEWPWICQNLTCFASCNHIMLRNLFPRHDDSCCHVPMALGECDNGFMSFVHDLNVRIDPSQASEWPWMC